MEYVKTFMEALNMKLKYKAVIFLSGLIILLLKPIAKLYNMEWLYNNFSWIIILITVISGIVLAVDLFTYVSSEIKIRITSWKLDKYILNLTGRKLQIVKAIYEGKGRAAKFRVNDTDLRELVARKVIVQAMENYAVYPNEENLSNPPMYFLLQPRTLELIEKNPDFFTKRK